MKLCQILPSLHLLKVTVETPEQYINLFKLTKTPARHRLRYSTGTQIWQKFRGKLRKNHQRMIKIIRQKLSGKCKSHILTLRLLGVNWINYNKL